MKTSSILLVCYVSSAIGLGHLTRLLALAQAIKKVSSIQIELLIFGDLIERDELSNFNITFLSLSDEFESSVKQTIEALNPAVVVFDLCPKLLPDNLIVLFTWLKNNDTKLVSIDSLIDFCHVLDLVWVPSFYFDFKDVPACVGKIKSGWDSFLIQKRLPSQVWQKGMRVLVLTGGSDVTNLGSTLPNQLDALLNDQVEVNWVRGPYAKAPLLPDNTRLKWNIHNAPNQLDELIVQSNYVLTVFGVSFFEVLQYGIPTVVFSPYDDKDNEELIALAEEQVAVVEKNSDTAVPALKNLMQNTDLAKSISQKALSKLSVNGAHLLAESVLSIAEIR